MATEFQLKLTFGSYFRRIGQRFGNMRKQRSHFLPRFQIELIGFHFEAVFITDRLTGADANEHILYLSVFLAQIMNIVRGNK
ncbi:hypothetical protein D3C76_1597290 [compost metagenome]